MRSMQGHTKNLILFLFLFCIQGALYGNAKMSKDFTSRSKGVGITLTGEDIILSLLNKEKNVLLSSPEDKDVWRSDVWVSQKSFKISSSQVPSIKKLLEISEHSEYVSKSGKKSAWEFALVHSNADSFYLSLKGENVMNQVVLDCLVFLMKQQEAEKK